ncbi:hypothetical protein WJ978_29330 [Achromobacter xylosoxidans]
MARFHAYVDELIEFPGIAEFPEQPCRPDELPAFFRRVRAARPDVALQMHGSGVHSNRIVGQLGAARWGGFVADAGAQIEGRRLCWPDDLPEPQRYLALLRSGPARHRRPPGIPVRRRRCRRRAGLCAATGSIRRAWC